MKYRLGRERNGSRGARDINQMSNEDIKSMIASGASGKKYSQRGKKVLQQRGVLIG